MDLYSDGLVLLKQKQSVLIDTFCEPCFIMYLIGNGDLKCSNVLIVDLFIYHLG